MSAATRDWLFSLEFAGIKLGLAQIRALLDALDHPEQAFPSLIVAGTNGKGSVAAMIERGLRAAGYRTGRYTSPHLVDITERVALDGRPIGDAAFDATAARVRVAAQALATPPSFFEATTALALEAFRDARVDIAVLEVGLGGRLDATNAVDAPLVAITAIDLDHQAYLGSTIEAIAAEKAGVIKPGATVVLGANPWSAASVVRAVAVTAGAAVIDAPAGVTWTATVGARDTALTLTTPTRPYGRMRLGLAGRHQIDNAITAVRVLEALPALGLPVPDASAVRAALGDVVWPARLEWTRWRGHDVLIDGAHNPAGARALAAFLQEMIPRPVPIVVGVMMDKAAPEIIAALAPVASAFLATAAPTRRALGPEDLARVVRDAAPAVEVVPYADPMDAVAHACTLGTPVVVAGSLFLAGHIRGVLA